MCWELRKSLRYDNIKEILKNQLLYAQKICKNYEKTEKKFD